MVCSQLTVSFALRCRCRGGRLYVWARALHPSSSMRRGAATSGQSLAHAFVHTEDVGELNAKWAELSSLREHSPDGMSCTVKVRLLHFQLLRPVTEMEGMGRHFTACEFVSLHLQLIMPPVVRGPQVSSSTPVLVVTSLASAMAVPQGPFRQVDASTAVPWEWQKIYAGGRLRSSGRLIEAMHVLSGVYAWDSRLQYPGCISPGAFRLANNGRMTQETAPEVTQLQRAMGHGGGWYTEEMHAVAHGPFV